MALHPHRGFPHRQSRPRNSLRGELAFNSKGRFLAFRTEWLCDSGAYLGEAGILTNSLNGMAIGAGVYQVEALYSRHRQIITNTAPTNAYRGASRPEANLIVERLVDEAALKLKIDPLELRRRNLIEKEQMPYKTLTASCLTAAIFDARRQGARGRRLGWLQGPPPRVKETASMRSIGCGMFVEPRAAAAFPRTRGGAVRGGRRHHSAQRHRAERAGT